METKICSKCCEIKGVDSFNKNSRNKSSLRAECKECQNHYYNLNKEKIKNQRKERYLVNTDLELSRNKKYYLNNKSSIIESLKIKRQTNHLFRLKNNIRVRLTTFLKTNKIHKDNLTFDIVGCSPEFLKEYIENKFTESMSWELMGKHIHIDHIIPLSSAKSEEELYKLCHYTNLQPLWAEDNLKKGSKIT